MAESYSVKATLSALDKGFTSTLKKCSSALGSIDKKVSGFSFGVLSGAGMAAFNTITSGVKGVVSEINSSNAAWKTFEGNMKIIGKSEKDINSVKKTLQDYATQTIYSSSDMATTYAQLAAVGVKSADKLVTGFGGLAAAAENPTQAMKTLSQQATQMAGKPTVAWADFKLMMEQTPAGIASVAKEMGMSTSDLVKKIQAGEVATSDFFAAVQEVGNSDGFTKLATEYKTVDQAIGGLTETVGNKLTPAFDVFSKKAIGVISGLVDKMGELDASKIATNAEKWLLKAERYWNVFKQSFSGVWTEVKSAANRIIGSIRAITGSFGSTKSLNGFKGIMDTVANAIKKVANFAEKHAGAIAKLITNLPKIWLAIKGFKVASAVAPFVTTFAKGLVKMGTAVGKGLAGKLSKTADAQKEVGDSAKSSSGSVLEGAKAFALMAVGVLLIAAGFALLAQSAIALSGAGGLAIGVMAGLVIGVAALGLGMAMLLKSLAPMSAQMMPVATAFLAMGAAVLLISVGFALLTQSAIALAGAGWGAIAVMVGMVAVIALLAVGAAILGTALTAGAIGFLAFGAALLMVGVAALIASVGVMIIANSLPLIVQYGLQGALALAALGASMLVFGAGALVAGLGCTALGVGLAVVAVGLALVGAAVLVTAVGVLALAAGGLLLAASLALVGTSLTLIAAVMPATAAGTLLLVAGFTLLLAVATLTGAILTVMSIALAATGIAAAAGAIGIAAFGIAMTAGAVGVLAMAAALKGVSSQMKTISKNAKSAEKSLKSMKNSVKVVESGLDALGSKAKSAMNKLTNAFDNAAGKAQSAGQKVGTGFTTGMQTGLALSPAIANQMVSATCTALSSGYASAYSSGAFISMGFANGMLSQLATIRRAASQMAQAADEAVRAKAKIASPSKEAKKLGAFWGEGLAVGMLDMVRDVWNAAQTLVDIPVVSAPNLALAYGGEMSSDYEYYRNERYTFDIPVTVDGREVARATATYTQDELNKRQTRENRKYGRV